jgi:hypothetical protein
VPLVELFGKIGRRLRRQRRVARAIAFSLRTMARGAGRQASRRVAALIERRRAGIGDRRGRGGRDRQGGIIGRNRLALFGAQLLGDRLHLRVMATTVTIGFELRFQIALVQSRQPRRACAVAAPVHAVTGDARVRRPRIAAAQRDQFAGRGKLIGTGAVGDAAASEQQGQGGCERARVKNHCRWGTCTGPKWFRRCNA